MIELIFFVLDQNRKKAEIIPGTEDISLEDVAVV